ncbi:uncharacterized protein LOC131949727 [Physella acuta]|uniref:uncharacterized protein LOC131949727 n=1 Tax=Physella acuta TaxID=109671 RepID=UPI0027DE3902|nr:uncharacterized protein LOC131949727 [Physella acuta]
MYLFSINQNMKITFIAVLALVALCRAAPSCEFSSIKVTMTRCLTDHGFTLDEIEHLIPNDAGAIDFNENDHKAMCSKRSEYKQSLTCFMDEVARCHTSVGVSIKLNLDQSTKAMDQMCDDPHYKIDCVVLLTKNSTEVQKCVTENYDFATELHTKTNQEVLCAISKVALACALDIVRKCDEHTADVSVAGYAALVSAVCSNTTDS